MDCWGDPVGRPMKKLSLSLLMLGILADNSAHALAFAVASDDETAVLTDWRAGGADFHGRGGGGTGCCRGEALLRPSDVGVGPGPPGDVGENR